MASLSLTVPAALAMFAAGGLAGMVNAIAGGGSLFSFPVFLATGLPPIVANASNAVAVWPGHALATFGFRRELKEAAGGLWRVGASACAGGLLGAFLLARVGNSTFTKLIPLLLIVATLLFAFGPAINRRLASSSASVQGFGGLTAVFAFSVYGGFFGAGLGIMLMAGLLMLGVRDVNHNNALKNLLAMLATSVGAIVLAASGLVAWQHTLIAFCGAVAGGLLGAELARKMSVKWLRRGVIAMGCALSLHYLFKS